MTRIEEQSDGLKHSRKEGNEFIESLMTLKPTETVQ